ncbi:hypothetical protein N7457_000107 [Penicillium paradoxum]|uniref:uncharacterized protein n=1 Tax=Penicillium paradoxum TaxID=176176 RepID=UPI0025477DCD|nr:uncharacterized protein N7457_000107 [Penicillium paradoxum]KAJ5793508.1 hypothetical protein N7457_000107 [Penicillium paradoxum]
MLDYFQAYCRKGIERQLEAYITSKKTKTYNSEDSLVVTHPTTNSPACGLSTAERTGSPIFHTLWSYVLDATLAEVIL